MANEVFAGMHYYLANDASSRWWRGENSVSPWSEQIFEELAWRRVALIWMAFFFFGISFFIFSQASERAGILNPRVWLANHAVVANLAFYDTAHGPDFISLLKVSGNRQPFACFTLPSTKSQRRLIAVHFKMARKVTVRKFNWVFWSCESFLT